MPPSDDGVPAASAGLTAQEAEARLAQFGPMNPLPQHTTPLSPISYTCS